MSASMLTRFAELAVTQLWQVTLLAIAVGLVVRLAAQRRPHLAYLLWMIVVVKCLTPPVVSSPTSLFSWAQFNRMQSSAASSQVNESPAAIATAASHDPNDFAKHAKKPRFPSTLAGTDEVGSALADAESTETASIAATPSVSSTTTAAEPVNAWLRPVAIGAAIVWLTGVAIFSAIIAAKWIRTRGLWRRCAAPPATVERQLAALAQRLHVRRRVRVLVSSEHVGPAVFGVMRPTILLPAQVVLEARPADLEPILAHELIHVRRGDSAASLLQLTTQLLWWFHPLIWWSNREARRERERACDEEVVAGLGYPPAQYARVLVDLLDALVRQRQPFALAGVPMLEVTARRLSHIVRDAKHFHARTPHWQWLLAVVLLLIVLPGAGMTWERESNVGEKPPADYGDAPRLVVGGGAEDEDQFTIRASDPLSALSPTDELARRLVVPADQRTPQKPAGGTAAPAKKNPTTPTVVSASTDADSDAHRRAVREIESLGGQIYRYRQPDGAMFVHVTLPPRWKGGDKGLSNLKDISDLSQLTILGEVISRDGLAQLKGLATVRSMFLIGVNDEQLARMQLPATLEHLQLEHETYTDAGLAHVAGLTKLKNLSLTQSKVSDDGLAPLMDLKELTSLSLVQCPNVSGRGLGALAKLTSLDALTVYAAPLSDDGVVQLGKLAGLRIISLECSKVTAAGFAPLANLKKAEVIQLSRATMFDDAASKYLVGLSQLRDLAIYDARLSDVGLESLAGLTKLMALQVFNDESVRDQFTDKGLAQLSRLTDLRVLRLRGRFTDQGLASLSPLVALERLFLTRSQIQGGGTAKLTGLAKLRVLGFDGGRVNDEGLRSIAQLKTLEELHVADTSITDAGLAQLAKLARLKQLTLRGTKITDAGLKQLADLKNLRTLLVEKTAVTNQGKQWLKERVPTVEFSYADWSVSGISSRDDDTTGAVVPSRENGKEVSENKPTEPKVIPAASDTDSAAHRKAVAEIEKLGGVVQRVRMPNGKKFVSIGLAEKWTGGDEGVDLLNDVTDLKFVSLDCRRFTPQGVARLGQFDRLESVHLLNPVDAQLARVQGWRNVQSLTLEGGTYTDAGLAPLSTLPGLKDLSLVTSPITDDAMDNLKNLAALEKLQLTVCGKLSGSKFGSLAALPNLHEIIVMVTPLSAQGLAELAKLPRLARLTLDAAKFKSDDFAGLAKMTNLVHLMLNQALAFDDQAAMSLSKLTGLRNLILYNTHLTDAGLMHLRGLKSLETLLVERDDGEFTDKGLSHLTPLDQLHSLSLGHGHFTDEGLADIARLKQLRGFSLTGPLEVTDDGVASLAGLKHMTTLSLSGAAVTDRGLASLAAMENLDQLDVSHTQATGSGLARLTRLKNLRSLNLAGTKLNDEGLANLAKFAALEELDLTGTAVTDAGLAVVATLPRLQRLMLERTKITDAGLQQLGGIKTLHELGLGGTKVTKAGMTGLKKKLPEIEIAADDVVFIKDMDIPLFDVPPPPADGAKP